MLPMTFSRSDEFGVALQALCDQFRMLDVIYVGEDDDAGYRYLPASQLDIAEDRPLVLVTRVRALERDTADIRFEHGLDDVLQRHVAVVWSLRSFPNKDATAPARAGCL